MRLLIENPELCPSTVVFSVPLEDAARCSDQFGLVPSPLSICAKFIDENNYYTNPAIYSENVDASKIYDLKMQFNEGKIFIEDETPAGVVSSIMRLYIRELPQHIVTDACRPYFDMLYDDADATTIEALAIGLQRISPPRKASLKVLLLHLQKLNEKNPTAFPLKRFVKLYGSHYEKLISVFLQKKDQLNDIFTMKVQKNKPPLVPPRKDKSWEDHKHRIQNVSPSTEDAVENPEELEESEENGDFELLVGEENQVIPVPVSSMSRPKAVLSEKPRPKKEEAPSTNVAADEKISQTGTGSDADSIRKRLLALRNKYDTESAEETAKEIAPRNSSSTDESEPEVQLAKRPARQGSIAFWGEMREGMLTLLQKDEVDEPAITESDAQETTEWGTQRYSRRGSIAFYAQMSQRAVDPATGIPLQWS
eukprot:TRINITY_DN2474_c0_g1_i4.p1 TRINITY_DN2474_c0_g1~~TRINITY_DN2474_c0_g1_i4.p1  ORF type:complete len:423 (+),score=71.06 TRINITY_DN2474_c0_g1_i4:475-1743(+)